MACRGWRRDRFPPCANRVIMFVLVSWAFLHTSLLCRGEPLRIVDQGQARAAVVLPAGSSAALRAAAQLLVRYVRQASGAELPVGSEPFVADARSGTPPLLIHVGAGEYAKSCGLRLKRLDGDGFVIRPVDAGHLVIAGPTDEGTEFGIYEFLERYVGVRWLLPGSDGDDVPQHATLDVPAGEVRQEPAFFSRLFSGLSGDAQTTWARRNRMHGRVEFHHNLLRLIPPETYAKSHPEFFPIRDGKRHLPANNQEHGWQPCFSAPGLAEEAAANIERYFAAHPQASSYSLGANDSSGYCQCEACQAQQAGAKNFLGLRDCSNSYFAWCNAVVQRVRQRYPDKWFGCLAYSEVAQPPDRVRIDGHIIPFMTYDRMKWIDPALRAEGQAMTRRWRQASPVVGWYDYVYGSPYLVPRVWFHRMAEDYRFAQSVGVKAVYAEAYPNWGEGPKLYLMLKLLWDPQADVDGLLRDWYVRAVGPEAADDLAAYYRLWEDFWTRRILQSKWFSKRGQYLAFYHPGYLDDVTDGDIARCRQLLERVVALAHTPTQKARAGLLLRAFDYYEASAVAYGARRKAAQLPVQTEADALRTLDEAQRCQAMAAKRMRLALEEFPRDPVLRLPIDFTQTPLLRGDTWGNDLLWPAFDWAARGEGPVRQRLRRLAAASGMPASLQARTMLLLVDPRAKPVSRNPAFTAGKGGWAEGWGRWVRDRGKITLDAKAGVEGRPAILCTGVTRGGPLQDLDLPAGRYGAVAMLRVPQAVQGNATLTLTMVGLDEKRRSLGPPLSSVIPARAGVWTRLAVAGDIPAAYHNTPLKQIRLIVVVDGFQRSEEAHVGQLALYRLDP